MTSLVLGFLTLGRPVKYNTNEERKAALKTSQVKYRSKSKEKLAKYAHRYYFNHKEERADYQRAHMASESVRKNRSEWDKKDRRKNPERSLFRSAKARAKRDGLEFNISLLDVIIPKFCPVYNEPLVHLGEDRNFWPTLDRIDSSRGYVKNNVRVISMKANTNKKNMSIDDLERLLSYMKESVT